MLGVWRLSGKAGSSFCLTNLRQRYERVQHFRIELGQGVFRVIRSFGRKFNLSIG